MIAIPSDSTAKFLTFAGAALLIACGVQQHLMIGKLEEAVATQIAAGAEVKELLAQHLSALQNSSDRMKESADLFAESAAIAKSGDQPRALARRATAEERFKDALSEKQKSKILQDTANQKAIEFAKLSAIATHAAETTDSKNLLYMFGMAIGAAVSGHGFTRWSTGEKKKHAPFKPRKNDA